MLRAGGAAAGVGVPAGADAIDDLDGLDDLDDLDGPMRVDDAAPVVLVSGWVFWQPEAKSRRRISRPVKVQVHSNDSAASG